jgi:hypothetical protein
VFTGGISAPGTTPAYNVKPQITADRYYAAHLLGDLKDPRAVQRSLRASMPDNRRHPAQYLSVTVLKWPLESGRWATRNCPMGCQGEARRGT